MSGHCHAPWFLVHEWPSSNLASWGKLFTWWRATVVEEDSGPPPGFAEIVVETDLRVGDLVVLRDRLEATYFIDQTHIIRGEHYTALNDQEQQACSGCRSFQSRQGGFLLLMVHRNMANCLRLPVRH